MGAAATVLAAGGEISNDCTGILALFQKPAGQIHMDQLLKKAT
jgi:hypothetical protein